jgi:DeoR/GlpR family transcriptional regulator of sugar metabolism
MIYWGKCFEIIHQHNVRGFMDRDRRLERIVACVQAEGFVAVNDLSQQFNLSKVTIRRDLQKLEDEHKLRRTHGGAVPLQPQDRRPCAGEAPLAAGQPTRSLIERVDVLITPVLPAHRLLLDLAERNGIPIISESGSIGGEKTLIAVDNRKASRALGRWAGAYSQTQFEGRANLLTLTYHLESTKVRSEAFLEGLKESNPEAKLVLSVNGQSRYRTAYQVTRDALTAYPDINVIFTINDIMGWGAYQACTDLAINPDRVLVVPFGLEGNTLKDALSDNRYCKAGLAMFPEIVGPVCIEAAIRAHNQQTLPDHLVTPYAVVTPETLSRYYERDETDWQLKWEAVTRDFELPLHVRGALPSGERPSPKRIGFIIPFREHEWYRNLQASMETYAGALHTELEVLDAEQSLRSELNRRQQAIAEKAAAQVEPGDVVLIDASEITTRLARALIDQKGITVITNSVAVFDLLRDNHDITLTLTGGHLRPGTETLGGSMVELTLRELRADKLFLTTSGITFDFGLSHADPDAVATKQAMIRVAREIILLADHTRFGKESTRQVAPADVVDKLITDDALPASARLELTQRGTEVIIA